MLAWIMKEELDSEKIYRLKMELAELEREWVKVGEREVKPSQCYRLSENPLRILYNADCPDSLKTRIEKLIRKHMK